MNDTHAISQRLKSWIESSLVRLSRANPAHIHADELLGRRNGSRQDWLAAIKAAYLEAIDILGDRLGGIMPVLMIPLTDADALTCHLPDLAQLDLGDEIPSIYLIDRDASKYLAKSELYRRFLVDFSLFDPHPPNVFFFYEVLRPEQQRIWGWEYTRTIKAECYLPEHRVD